MTDSEGNEHQNVLTLTKDNVSYYFVADMANNRLIYYTNATVTGVDGVVNSKGDGETLLDVVGIIPKSFDDITLEAIVFTAQELLMIILYLHQRRKRLPIVGMMAMMLAWATL